MVNATERFRALIDKSPDAISLVDAECQVLYASASTTKVLGYRPDELLGRNGLDLLHPLDRDHSVRSLQKVLAEPQWPSRVQARVRQKSGRWVWVESTTSNLLDEPHVGAIVINYREIEARRAEEEDRERLVEELTRSNAELKQYAHTVAHDLREPFRTISALTALLLRNAHLREADKRIAQLVVDGVGRMSTLLDELLASANVGFIESLRPVELGHAAAQAMQNLREALDASGASITIDPLPTVQGYESEYVRLFQNLISNAVKYRSGTAVVVHITAERAGPDWVIRVRDNGVGISKEHHRRIFGLLTRLHAEDIPGTGIGLAICKKIVEGLGGAIWVESEPGAGSTFCFTVAADRENCGKPEISGTGTWRRSLAG